MLVLVLALGIGLLLKSPFGGMLRFAELFEMKAGCAFFFFSGRYLLSNEVWVLSVRGGGLPLPGNGGRLHAPGSEERLAAHGCVRG